MLLPLPPARSSPPRPVVSSFALPGTPSLRSHHARPNKRRCERGMLPPRAALPRSGRRRLTPTAPDARTCCGLFPGCRPPPSRLHRLPLDPDDPRGPTSEPLQKPRTPSPKSTPLHSRLKCPPASQKTRPRLRFCTHHPLLPQEAPLHLVGQLPLYDGQCLGSRQGASCELLPARTAVPRAFKHGRASAHSREPGSWAYVPG